MLNDMQYANMTDRTREDFGLPKRSMKAISIHPYGRSDKHRADQRKRASR